MNNQNSFNIILKSKIYIIPSCFRSLSDINPDIYNKLLTDHQYEVKSDVSEEVFQSFINNWVKSEPLDIQNSNISEYVLLYQEFDRLKELSQIFTNIDIVSLANDIKNIQDENKELKNKLQIYNQMILFIFQSPDIDTRFPEIKKDLYHACQKQDIDTICLLTQKIKKINGFSFSLNMSQNTATVTCIPSKSQDIVIPQTITHNAEKFLVTSIVKKIFYEYENIKSIQFPESLISIGKRAFCGSGVETITIPSSFSCLKSKGWCIGAAKLNTINILPCKEKKIILYEEKYLLEMSDEKSGIYDSLCFVPRNIKIVNIPSFVKTIASFAFNECNEIQTVNFEGVSQLQKIEKGAFFFCSIRSITIPRSVTTIGKDCFSLCAKFECIKFEENSELKSIEESLFYGTSISKIEIPSHVTQIGKSAFSRCKNLKSIEFPDDSELQLIDDSAFYESAIEEILIPIHVKRIGEKCFYYCTELTDVDFFTESELETIDEEAFAFSSISGVSIGKNVTKIGKKAFLSCLRLQKVVIDSDSKLKTINNAFSGSSIESIYIPASVKKFDDDWCFDTPKLSNIYVDKKNKDFMTDAKSLILLGKTDPKSDKFDLYLFGSRLITSIQILPNITCIAPCAFSKCKLQKVSFANNSQLRYINDYAFSDTMITEISLPSSLTRIGKNAFSDCKLLKSVLIEKNVTDIDECAFDGCKKLKAIDLSKTKIKIIKESSFRNSGLVQMHIPSSVTEISTSAFECCHNLTLVDFQDDSELEIIGNTAFSETCINNITIPKHVKKIDDFAFTHCEDLYEVKFTENSELEVIGKFAFSETNLSFISIPSSVEQLGIGWCSNSSENLHIQISTNSKYFMKVDDSFIVGKSDPNSDVFDSLLFVKRSIECEFTVPSFVKKIDSHAFNCCNLIKTVKFSENSETVSICDFAFEQSGIENIMIHPKIEFIGNAAFECCNTLKNVEFTEDSQLSIIGEKSFSKSGIECISLPSSVESIGDDAFAQCSELKIVEIPENSKLESINTDMFLYLKDIVIMIPHDFKGSLEK